MTQPEATGNGSQRRIGKAIRAQRLALRMSLAHLAEGLGIAPSSLSKLENGLTPITFERLERISGLLGVDIALILAGGAPPNEAAEPPHSAVSSALSCRNRRSVTRVGSERALDAGLYTIHFHATDLLEKKMQPFIADVQCTALSDYGPYTRHDGEEFNYVLNGSLEFFTDVYSSVILHEGDSIYFDAEMGHAHIRLGDAPCRILGAITPRTDRPARNAVVPVMEVRRASLARGTDGESARDL